jgi:hypothetical protein
MDPPLATATFQRAVAFLRYRTSVREHSKTRADEMHDHVEVWVNEGGAGNEDAR